MTAKLSPAPSASQSHRAALLVMLVGGEMTLFPFFAKADGVLVIDPDIGQCEFMAKTKRTTEAMCELILRTGARRLILGFVPVPAARRLRAAGIDIRLGSWACSVQELAACFGKLPTA